MKSRWANLGLELIVLLAGCGLCLFGGVRVEIEKWYIRQYENRAMFLKVPVRGDRQLIYVRDSGMMLDTRNAGLPLRFKVGDQIRILKVDFRGDSIRFKIGSIDLSRQSEIEFQFPLQLQDQFPQRAAFDAALDGALTEGLSYTDVDSAKGEFIRGQFDDFVRRLAKSSDLQEEAVVQALAEKIPGYRDLQRRSREMEGELDQARQRLTEEAVQRRQLQTDLRRRTEELDQSRGAAVRLERERDNLREEKRVLERRIENLSSHNRDYEQQLEGLGGLGRQVETLKSSLTSLKQERESLSRRLEQTDQQLKGVERERDQLAQELKRLQGERDSLWEDVRTLTSNRKGIEARYIEVKREKENLEIITDLIRSLRLDSRIEMHPDGTASQLADLYLLDAKLGTFEITIPEVAGRSYPLRFLADSPDTVKFSDEERRLYEVLGERLRIEPSWRTSSEKLRVVLMKNESLQSVGPRESVEWGWLFQGDIARPERASLVINLLHSGGRKLLLGSQDFTVTPGKFWARLLYTFSPLSAAAGALLAMGMFGLFFGFRGRSRKASTREGPGRDPVVQKKL